MTSETSSAADSPALLHRPLLNTYSDSGGGGGYRSAATVAGCGETNVNYPTSGRGAPGVRFHTLDMDQKILRLTLNYKTKIRRNYIERYAIIDARFPAGDASFLKNGWKEYARMPGWATAALRGPCKRGKRSTAAHRGDSKHKCSSSLYLLKFTFICNSVIQPQPNLSLSSLSIPTTVITTQSLPTYPDTLVQPASPSLTRGHSSSIPVKVKRARASPSNSTRALKRSRSLAVEATTREAGSITRTSSLRNVNSKASPSTSEKPIAARLRGSASVTGTVVKQQKKRRAPKCPVPQISSAAQSVSVATKMSVPATTANLSGQSGPPISSVNATASTFTPPITVSSSFASTITTVTQASTSNAQPDSDVTNQIMAGLSRLEARVDARDDRVISYINQQITPRFAKIEAVQDELAQSIRTVRDDHANQLARLSERVDALAASSHQSAQLPPSQLAALQDEYEVRFDGLPRTVAISIETAERLLHALELGRLCPHVAAVREWRPRRPTNSPSAAGVTATVTMVVRFSCAAWRDEAARAYRRASDISLSHLFNVPEASTLNISAILPPPVYNLLRAAQRRSRELNYLAPVRRGLMIYMRPAHGVQPVLVNDIAALGLFQPRQLPAARVPTTSSS
ncbi:unnamed protein product [Trichogramma brassicae]|uniref:Uncharacterized protein n=1 Tax=Trichogramma brassicae TaxID=86971 RepID=A0A6H5I1B1_9HYME|nr:unnamed protein product [Trichogramma brassicae]